MSSGVWKSLFCVAASLAVAGAGAAQNISISVQDTEMRDVLKFISEQSGSNIVISPGISTNTLDISLQDVDLDDALDVILKPYGCGYRKVGKTVVVDKLENLDRLSAVEPLISRVITLKYLDAKGVSDIVEGLLSDRGTVKVLSNTQKLGWQFAASGGNETQSGKLARADTKDKGDDQTSSRTIVVSDTPSVITRIQDVIAEVDVQPRQIEIRSYFVEFSNGADKDIGVTWGLSKDTGNLQTGEFNYNKTNGVTSVFNPAAGTAFDKSEQGLLFGLVRTGGSLDISAQLSALQENQDVNVLSAPRIVAQENEEATILVGEKYPIITSSSDGQSGKITIKLDYFERIGIQLNVIPQICDDKRISMVIHPAVTELGETIPATIIDTSGNASQLQTPFPRITTREAETRLTVNDGQTVAIGGLVNERDVDGVQKVPLLGDIPVLGRLFRHDTTSKKKVDLVILMKASVVSEDESVVNQLSERVDRSMEKAINYWNDKKDVVEPLQIEEPEAEVETSQDVAVPSPVVESVVEVDAAQVAAVATPVVEPVVETDAAQTDAFPVPVAEPVVADESAQNAGAQEFADIGAALAK